MGIFIGLGIPTMFFGIMPLIMFIKGMIIGGIISGIIFSLFVLVIIAELIDLRDVKNRKKIKSTWKDE